MTPAQGRKPSLDVTGGCRGHVPRWIPAYAGILGRVGLGRKSTLEHAIPRHPGRKAIRDLGAGLSECDKLGPGQCPGHFRDDGGMAMTAIGPFLSLGSNPRTSSLGSKAGTQQSQPWPGLASIAQNDSEEKKITQFKSSTCINDIKRQYIPR